MLVKSRLVCADNLAVLPELPSRSVDLVYVDPPAPSLPEIGGFPLVATPEENPPLTLFGDQSTFASYLEALSERLIELQRVLAETGSIYIHTHLSVSAHVRLLADAVFGAQNFRSEIIWQRTRQAKSGAQPFPNVHDAILLYSIGPKYYFNGVSPAKLERDRSDDGLMDPETGRRYRLVSLVAPVNRSSPEFSFMGVTRAWRWSKERLEQALHEGRIVQTSAGAVPRLKQYLDETPGRSEASIWTNLEISQRERAYSGYVTQRPVSLLRRIVSASSRARSFVLDPFCGSGTSLVAAHELNRSWVGIEASPVACWLALLRLTRECGAQVGRDFTLDVALPPSGKWARSQEIESWSLLRATQFLASGKRIEGSDRLKPTNAVAPGFSIDSGVTMIPVGSDWLSAFVDQRLANDEAVRGFSQRLRANGLTSGLLIAEGFADSVHGEVRRLGEVEGIEIGTLSIAELSASA